MAKDIVTYVILKTINDKNHSKIVKVELHI